MFQSYLIYGHNWFPNLNTNVPVMSVPAPVIMFQNPDVSTPQTKLNEPDVEPIGNVNDIGPDGANAPNLKSIGRVVGTLNEYSKT
jgi:hypothetical protein